MKGIVFKELISMMEQSFGEELTDEIIDELELKSEGAYTSAGTYDHSEVLSIVTKLSEKTGADSRDLVKAFGSHLLKTFSKIHPEYFQVDDASIFLKSVHHKIHVEVRKLYPEADLPEIDFSSDEQKQHMVLKYSSKKPFADLAEGLLEQTFAHFNEKVEINSSKIEDKYSRTFEIKRVS